MSIHVAGRLFAWIGMYFVRGTVAFLPAVIFLRYARWHGTPGDEQWLAAFRLAAPFALAYLVYAAWRSAPANRLVLATNVYVLAGGLMAATGAYEGLHYYAWLRESAVLGMVVLVGAVTTAGSTAGFVALPGVRRPEVIRLSLLLLGAALIALLVSWLLRGQVFLAAVLPLMALSMFSRWLGRSHRHATTTLQNSLEHARD